MDHSPCRTEDREPCPKEGRPDPADLKPPVKFPHTQPLLLPWVCWGLRESWCLPRTQSKQRQPQRGSALYTSGYHLPLPRSSFQLCFQSPSPNTTPGSWLWCLRLGVQLPFGVTETGAMATGLRNTEMKPVEAAERKCKLMVGRARRESKSTVRITEARSDIGS